MRRVADSFTPLIGRQPEIRALFFVWIITDLSDDLVVFIEQSNPALEFGEERIIPSNVNSGRHTQIFLDHFHEIAIKVPIFDPVVVSVANQQERFALAGIQRNAMACIEFAFFLSWTPESFYEIPILIKLQDVI